MPKQTKKRTSSWIFDFENPKDEDILYLSKIDCKYIIYGRVKCRSEISRLRGFIHFKKIKSIGEVRKIVKMNRVEMAKTINGAINYCKKTGDFIEMGIKPLNRKEKKEKYSEAILVVKEDKITENDREIENYIANDTVLNIHQPNYWYYGENDKSKLVRAKYPDLYFKLCSKWWDGYNDQKVVLIENVDKKCKNLLEMWTSKCPFRVECKGESSVIGPLQIIVTSKYHPKDIWSDDGSVDLILSRFIIKEFIST